MTDIALISLPKLEIKAPLLALGQLKSCVESNGFTCKTFDFNMWLYQKTKDTDLNNIWDPLDNTLLDEELLEQNKNSYIPLIDEFIKNTLLKVNPKIIGLSVFSFWTFPILKLFLKQLKKVFFKKIVIGGPALTSLQSQNQEQVTLLLEGNLINDFISGDAEISLVEYIKGNTEYPGINNYEYNNNFIRDELPYADFSDFDLSLYKSRLYVSGSRGCVRKCAFCNVPLLWTKYMSKSSDRIVDEIITYHERYGTEHFRIVDSLVNGNQKIFLDVLRKLSLYNETANDKIEWSGQFIIREKHQTPKEMFDLLKTSGCATLIVGIESGSEKVRRELKKPFSNSAVKYYLDEFERVGLDDIQPLMFVGFPTETDTDFEKSLDMLDLFSKYKCVTRIGSEHPMLVIPGTPVHIDMELYDIENYEDYFKWTSKHNDYKTRIERFFIFIDKARKLGIYPPPATGRLNIFADFYLHSVVDHNSDVLKIINGIKG